MKIRCFLRFSQHVNSNFRLALSISFYHDPSAHLLQKSLISLLFEAVIRGVIQALRKRWAYPRGLYTEELTRGEIRYSRTNSRKNLEQIGSLLLEILMVFSLL